LQNNRRIYSIPSTPLHYSYHYPWQACIISFGCTLPLHSTSQATHLPHPSPKRARVHWHHTSWCRVGSTFSLKCRLSYLSDLTIDDSTYPDSVHHPGSPPYSSCSVYILCLFCYKYDDNASNFPRIQYMQVPPKSALDGHGAFTGHNLFIS